MTKQFLRTFGPFAITNYRLGKQIPLSFMMGLKLWPVADAQLDVEVGDQRDRMTATRILAGGVLLGPAGMILGGLARKDVTRGKMTLTVNGEKVQTYEFKGHDVDRAVEFVEALAEAQASQSPATPPAPPTWAPDPGKRHQLRWWDGTRWTEHVSDDAQQSIDPLR
ncbi:MAG: DUF2510 domain-containing protein [Thermomicrobiales bacterium]